jgi:hypothetical protein
MLRNFEALVVGVSDFEVEIIEGISVEDEVKSLADRTRGFQIVIILTGVSERERNGGSVGVRACHLVVCLREDRQCYESNKESQEKDTCHDKIDILLRDNI